MVGADGVLLLGELGLGRHGLGSEAEGCRPAESGRRAMWWGERWLPYQYDGVESVPVGDAVGDRELARFREAFPALFRPVQVRTRKENWVS